MGERNPALKSSIQPIKIFSKTVHAPAQRVGRFGTEKGWQSWCFPDNFLFLVAFY